MSLQYICEGWNCENEIPEEYSDEWDSLRFQVTDRETQAIAEKGCKYISSTWVKLAETEHLVLWQEG